MELIYGFLLGIGASTAATVFYEYATRPLLEIRLDQAGRAQGQVPGQAPHEFYHLTIRNLPAWWPFPGRRPAWSCKASIEAFNPDGSPAVSDPVPGRWTSQPEPLLPVIRGDAPANLLDPARLMQARKVDIHNHEDQRLSVALKFEGEPACHLFSNESYRFPKWQNPEWCLGPGTYRLRVSVFYETGCAHADFELANLGLSCNDVRLVRVT
jgi:hypothetical protein